MALSEAHAQGFALAAILQDDRDLEWATAHLDAPLLQRATERMREVRDAADKREALARLVRAVHGERDLSLLSPACAARLSERAKHEPPEASGDVASMLSRLARRGASI